MRGTCRAASVLAILAVLCGPAAGGDWPGWRGPSRNGIVADSPPLIEAMPEGGPTKLWESEPLHPAGTGGYGSPVVVDGRVYVFADWGYSIPKDDRIVTQNDLNGHGYVPDMPTELSAKVEAARTSEERKVLDRRAVEPWVNEWLKANVPEEQKKFRGAAQARLRAGPNAVPLDVLAKMATVVDKVFPNEDALNAWFKENGIDDATRKEATKWVRTANPASRDFLLCLDAKTGKTLWKTEVPARDGQTHGDSSTPAVANGRVFAITASSTVVCLDATSGAVVWKKAPFAQVSNPHSSVLVADGVLVASSARGTVGLDAATGELLWEAKALGTDNASPAAWKTDGGTRVIINSRKLACVDAKTGKVIWDALGGGSATPAVVGDHLACVFRQKLVAYRLSAESAEKLWEIEFKDDYASPLILGDHVYAVGAPNSKKQGRAVCVELKTGKIAWEGAVEGGPTCSSPVAADGKLVAFAPGHLVLIKAATDKYTELGRAKIGGEGWTSPTVADGRLYCRIGSKVVCYDLAK